MASLDPLPPRLAALAEALEVGTRVADIGSDHGLLPLWLAATGRAAHVLVTEKTEARLARVRLPPGGAPWGGLLSYRAGDGLQTIRPADGIDTIVLAGIGGRTVARLLARDARVLGTIRRLVLQPRSDHALVRGVLSELGFCPIREALPFERGRFHLTLSAERGDDREIYRHPSLDREDLLAAGPLLTRSRHPDLARLWRAERARLSAILASGAARGASSRLRSGIGRCDRILEVISQPGG